MSLRSNGSYIGPRPAGPTNGGLGVASGIWDLRTAQRQRAKDEWPFYQLTDPDFANVVLLLHMDGINGSTTFTDSSSYGRTATVYRNAALSNTQSKFGGTSGYFSGGTTGSGSSQRVDTITFADSDDFNMGSSDWTIEAWVYVTSFALTQEIWAHRDGSGGTPLHLLRLNTSGTVRAYFNTGTTDVTTSETLSSNTWHHIAVVRDSGTVAIYIDGTAATLSGTNGTGAYGNPPGNVAIASGLGSPGIGGWDGQFSGYIDEFRWTIGTARYTANFTPPTAPFPDDGPPGQVTGLTASGGDGTLDLSWSAPAGTITDYSVEYTPSGGSATTVLVGSATTTYQLTSLTNDTEYSVRVAAVSAGGTGAYSSAVTVTPTAVVQVDYLVIAGGGGGGVVGGGGGAGGYRSSVTGESSGGGSSAESKFSAQRGTSYTVTVGGGGAGKTSPGNGRGTSGNASSFSTVSCSGGGGGASRGTPTQDGATGGSGGGGRFDTNAGAGTSSEGFAGGSGGGAVGSFAGGGGGGAGQQGNDAPNTTSAGDGGNGLSSAITGTSVTRAGGGGGGQSGGSTNSSGGSGGGGLGARNNTVNGGSGTANTGSGGGSGGESASNYSNGGSGGSGVVIIRAPQAAASTTGSPTVTTDGGDTIYTFTGSGSITF